MFKSSVATSTHLQITTSFKYYTHCKLESAEIIVVHFSTILSLVNETTSTFFVKLFPKTIT